MLIILIWAHPLDGYQILLILIFSLPFQQQNCYLFYLAVVIFITGKREIYVLFYQENWTIMVSSLIYYVAI